MSLCGFVEEVLFCAVLGTLFCIGGASVLKWCDDHYKVKWEVEEYQRRIRECEFRGMTWTQKWGAESREYLCPDGSYITVRPNLRNAKGE
jgi:hypothetical protein